MQPAPPILFPSLSLDTSRLFPARGASPLSRLYGPRRLPSVTPCRNADMGGQVGQLRAQLLRSEQEKELMRMTLQEEKEEREKAQKQVGCAHVIRLGGEALMYAVWADVPFPDFFRAV